MHFGSLTHLRAPDAHIDAPFIVHQTMLLNSVLFVFGLVILYLGAEWLIKGSASLALRYGIRPLVIGLTVVAFGTSMPEFVVNLVAAYSGQDDLALGNIIGSNISNIGLILGASALVVPLVIGQETLRKEYPIMMAAMLLFYGIALDGVISQIDGFVLVAGLLAFLTYLVVDARRYARSSDDVPSDVSRSDEEGLLKKALLVVAGIAGLAFGANMMVEAAMYFADALGIDPVIVGLTIVAVGTSLPELAASLVGAFRREMDMSVGNVLGSNLINVLFVIGLIALFRPLTVEVESLSLHFPVMLAFCLLLFPLMWTSRKITRLEGGMLITGFVAYILYLVLPYTY